MTSYYPSKHPAIAELAFTLRRLGSVLSKQQMQQVATAIVGRFYGLRQIRDTAYWRTRSGARVYLAVRLDGQSRVWLPHFKQADFGMIVATVDKDGVLDEVYNGSALSLLYTLRERGNRTVILTDFVERLAQLGLLQAFRHDQYDNRTIDANWLEHFPEDFRIRSTPLPTILTELREIPRRGDHPGDWDGENGGTPPPADVPPPPRGDGPGRGTGGIRELLNHAVLLSADKAFFDELFDSL